MSLLDLASKVDIPEVRGDSFAELGDNDLQTKINIYGLAEYLDIPESEYHDEKTAMKLSTIYKWAEDKGGLDFLKDIRMRLPVTDMTPDLDKLYAYVRLESEISKHKAMLKNLLKHRTKLL